MSRRVLVVTVVHHPLDARIRYRQIQALLEAGWQVTYAAPWAAYGLDRDAYGTEHLTACELPRATSMRRVRALREARRLIRRVGPDHDVVLVHDLELVLVARGRRWRAVWDVHEDTAAAVEIRPWIPAPLKGPAAQAVRCVETWAEGRLPLLLADHEYTRRFRREHPVVPNTTTVPEQPPEGPVTSAGRHRVVYLGSVTIERGVEEMIALAACVPSTIRVEVIGPAHGRAGVLLERAVVEDLLDWHGFVPSDEASRMLDGALAGLCLLHDEANFRPSMATKVVEYLAHAVPAVVTPLPSQAHLVHRSGAGHVVPFGDVDAVAQVLTAWAEDPQTARALGRAGHTYVDQHHNWAREGAHFVEELRKIADLPD